MNKQEFISELKKKISRLPEEEITKAVNYYEEYFDEAGEENEAKVIEELGTPASIASELLATIAIKETNNEEKSAKKELSALWLIILAIFASPIALPMALVLVILMFTLIIVVFSVVFSIGAVGVAFLLSGIVTFVASFVVLFVSGGTGIFMMGTGIVLTSLGIIMSIFITFIAKVCFSSIAKMFSKLVLRGKSNENIK